MVKEIIVHKMECRNDAMENCEIECVPFEKRYFEAYMEIYNECFYEMRKALDIEPYNFLHGYEQIAEKKKDIFLYVFDDKIIGSVACYENEIDDLIVHKAFQNKGYGKQLLLWGMQHIRKYSDAPVTLHVADWNKKAIALYEKNGFQITYTERVR